MKIAISFCLTCILIPSIKASKFSVRFFLKAEKACIFLKFTGKNHAGGVIRTRGLLRDRVLSPAPFPDSATPACLYSYSLFRL